MSDSRSREQQVGVAAVDASLAIPQTLEGKARLASLELELHMSAGPPETWSINSNFEALKIIVTYARDDCNTDSGEYLRNGLKFITLLINESRARETLVEISKKTLELLYDIAFTLKDPEIMDSVMDVAMKSLLIVCSSERSKEQIDCGRILNKWVHESIAFIRQNSLAIQNGPLRLKIMSNVLTMAFHPLLVPGLLRGQDKTQGVLLERLSNYCIEIAGKSHCTKLAKILVTTAVDAIRRHPGDSFAKIILLIQAADPSAGASLPHHPCPIRTMPPPALEILCNSLCELLQEEVILVDDKVFDEVNKVGIKAFCEQVQKIYGSENYDGGRLRSLVQKMAFILNTLFR